MMQSSKTRIGNSDVGQKTSPSAGRHARPGGSPRSPASEKKRPGNASDLEAQLLQVQQELKKTREVLCSAEQAKKRAIHEAEKAKKKYLAMASKLEDKQRELVEYAASEEARIQELRRLSHERDRAWQSELEAVQQQSSVDAAELSSAMNEIQRLKMQLEQVQVMKAEAEEITYRRQLEWANSVVEEAGRMVFEGQVVRIVEAGAAQELAERLKADSDLREAELRRLRIQCEQWRKAAETAAAILNSGNQGCKIMDSPYPYLGSKLMSSPEYDDAEETSPPRKNITVLRKLGFWKKAQK